MTLTCRGHTTNTQLSHKCLSQACAQAFMNTLARHQHACMDTRHTHTHTHGPYISVKHGHRRLHTHTHRHGHKKGAPCFFCQKLPVFRQETWGVNISKTSCINNAKHVLFKHTVIDKQGKVQLVSAGVCSWKPPFCKFYCKGVNPIDGMEVAPVANISTSAKGISTTCEVHQYWYSG